MSPRGSKFKLVQGVDHACAGFGRAAAAKAAVFGRGPSVRSEDGARPRRSGSTHQSRGRPDRRSMMRPSCFAAAGLSEFVKVLGPNPNEGVRFVLRGKMRKGGKHRRRGTSRKISSEYLVLLPSRPLFS